MTRKTATATATPVLEVTVGGARLKYEDLTPDLAAWQNATGAAVPSLHAFMGRAVEALAESDLVEAIAGWVDLGSDTGLAYLVETRDGVHHIVRGAGVPS